VDDERVIEIRPDGIEQIIQAQFQSSQSSDHLTPSRGGSLDSRTGAVAPGPRVVVCARCGSRFAEGIRFCGRCGNGTFQVIGGPLEGNAGHGSRPPASAPGSVPPASGPGISPSTHGTLTITCPRCKQTYPSTTRFCGRCGIPVGAQSLEWRQPRPVEVVCKLCGTSYANGTRFCGRCGKLISS
jgi:hypothetical protein